MCCILFPLLVSGNHNSCFIKFFFSDNQICQRAVNWLWLFPVLGFSKEILFLPLKLGAYFVEISLQRSSLIRGVRTYFQESQHGPSSERENVMRFWCTKTKHNKKSTQRKYQLSHSGDITRKSNSKENSARQIVVCLPLSHWKTVSNEWSQGGNEGNCRCKSQTQYQIKY